MLKTTWFFRKNNLVVIFIFVTTMIQRVVYVLKKARFLKPLLFYLSVFITGNILPVTAQNLGYSNRLLPVGDTVVKRILPRPVSDCMYVATDYTEIHFELDKAKLDISYMDNGLSFLHLDRVIDSLGIENITAIEIISQSSPEGPLKHNTTLTEHRSLAMMKYMKRVFPELTDKLTINRIAESWENLAQYVAQDPNMTDESIQKVLDIINSSQLSVNEKKDRLKSALGKDPNIGDIYSYLTKYYYPVIRNSGIYILHMVEPEKPVEIVPQEPHVEEIEPVYPDTIPYQPEVQVSSSKIRPLIAVKTNLAYDAFFTKDMGWAPIYNIEAELYPTEKGRWTWLLEYEFPWHSIDSKHQYLQILNLQLESRRYFKSASRHTGHYLSAYAGINLYDICFDKKAGHGYQGEGFGGGLGYGYVLPLGKKPDTRWKLEFFIKGGYYATFYDPYDAGSPFAGKYYYEWYDNPKLFVRRNMLFQWLGPTGAGITISYDLINKSVKSDK